MVNHESKLTNLAEAFFYTRTSLSNVLNLANIFLPRFVETSFAFSLVMRDL